MAKTYITIAKYQIKIKFSIEGIVDKHDVVGAIFGQSEGLLGEDMDLRELQKSGKIGRIEVKSQTQLGKTIGELIVPSSLDKVQTSMLAASIEAVDKVGPCESKFETIEIEDLREQKRKQVKDRAGELLKRLSERQPESQELATEIVAEMRSNDLKEFGREKLPAGPNIEKATEIIIVEGRADVLNLLKHKINNVIAIDGNNVPATIVFLCKQKTATLFIDGDRGGDLIARKVMQLAPISFIAKAPDGKEVEELSGKEILASLRKKKPVSKKPIGKFPKRKQYQKGLGKYRKRIAEPSRPSSIAPSQELNQFGPIMQELSNSLKARLLNEKLAVIKEVSVRDLLKTMEKEKNIYDIVFDGIVTQRLVEEAEAKNIKYLVGVKKGKIAGTQKVKVLTVF